MPLRLVTTPVTILPVVELSVVILPVVEFSVAIVPTPLALIFGTVS